LLWYNLELSCQKEKAFEIEEFLLGYGATSVSFTYQNNNEEFYELKPDETPLWELVKISAIFEKKITIDDIHNVLGKSDYLNVDISTFKDRNWVKSYQKNITPMQFGDRVWIIPSWLEHKPTPGDIIIKMDPGMAFGSGTHETTRLCLEYLEQNNLKDYHVVDYGCGSGILGIAAILLGAKSVLAVDNDPQSIKISNENAETNLVNHKLIAQHDNKEIGLQADLVIANIFSNVLLKLRKKFNNIVKLNGRVVLSGIIEEQLDTIITTYAEFFLVEKIVNRGNWYLIVLNKTNE